ncbi:MAG: hypothetical protein ABSD97_08405 [Acidimicrobiales bacterium]|jgi:hypothetical protein
MAARAFGIVAGTAAAVVLAVEALLTGSGAYAATARVVELADSSGAAVQRTRPSDLTITSVAFPQAAKLLYPGADVNVRVTISNPNPFAVTITAVSLPSDTTYASGYTTSAFTTLRPGCGAATPSDVIWSYSSGTSRTHTLTKPLTVAPKGHAEDPLTVVFIDAATMTPSAPAACEGSYFSMPALKGVTVADGFASITTSPVTDNWRS